MIDLSKFQKKSKFEGIGLISAIGDLKVIPTQNGEFLVQEYAIDFFYGVVEKPFVDVCCFQVTSRTTRKYDKELSAYVDAPSFIDQFKEKPLTIGTPVSIKCDISGYVGKEGKTQIPKITLETIFYHRGEDGKQVTALIELARANRVSAGL